ncbi:hypothetical protein VCRA2116O30_20284 [Vibrio crassostreae]|nr:hypothetical protein VCRA2116O30_20284 [Vibrio crassostreae]CAK2070795.1 hypothetical protein VCRA2113O20_30032 [Vibrio crassostreae]CAK2091424.1 hypothetical protein VCRA2119O45_30285 [Vibrio crassostreae]CAK2149297.1 hypothetical protein VCRA2117O39_40285 [Vibrio crassostreae]CAK2366905.1 hypothetical protein VCRA2119O49_40032 [Vibrio crassostreae]
MNSVAKSVAKSIADLNKFIF